MGDIVDLNAFRKQRAEEEEAKAAEEAAIEAEAKKAEAQAEIDYMQEVLSRILVSMGDTLTGSMVSYSSDEEPHFSDYTTYYHEAGYNTDGYYEKSWEYDPLSEDLPNELDDDAEDT